MSLFMLACQPTTPGARTEVRNVAEVELAPTSANALETAAADEPASDDTFAFPDDSGGKILSRILPPGAPERLPAAKTGPLTRTRLKALEQPEATSNPPIPTLPKLPPAKRTALHPHLPAEPTPLFDLREEIDTPRRPELPESERIRTPSRDVSLPIELPLQSRYSPDRAPTDDPTAEMSLEKALSQPQPLRTEQAPFVRINLPEPFENRASVRSSTPEPGLVTPTPMPPK
jgi:hypothetical protein